MQYKSISVTITDSTSDAPALAAAVALAIRENAHLEVHCVSLDLTRYLAMPDGSSAIMNELGLEEAQKQADALLTWVKATVPADLASQSAQAVVIAQIGMDRHAARLGRYSDLIVATKPYGKGHTALQTAVLEAGLFGTGAPVLVVPDTPIDFSNPFSRIMVAWNETDECFSAIRKSLPFLVASKHVDIVLVDPPGHSIERSDPGGSISLFLARHGVKAEVSILARSLPHVSDVLQRFAQEHAVEAMVMGAYGHSRFREAIFGGVTRDMLTRLTVPVIMTH